MKWIQRALIFLYNVLAFTGLAVGIAFLGGAVLVSYKFVSIVEDHLLVKVAASERQYDRLSKEFRLVEASRLLILLTQKTRSFDLIDAMASPLNDTNTPQLCKNLCAESSFEYESSENAADTDPIVFLSEYHKRQGPGAFADPKFRLMLESAILYSRIVPKKVRTLMQEILQAAGSRATNSEFYRITFAAKLPIKASFIAWDMAQQFDSLQAQAARVTDLNRLRENCGRTKPADTLRECVSLK